MLKFNKLFAILAMRGMKKTALLEIMNSHTLAALGKRAVNTNTIEKICEFLDVQPGDIMEYEKERKDESFCAKKLVENVSKSKNRN